MPARRPRRWRAWAAGVNVMTGGFRKSIALQPVSVEGNTGLYVGAGFASMSLELADF